MNLEKYKPFGLIFIVCLITGLILTGCGDYYEEGDDIAEQRFTKFTSQEKTLYKAVQDVWGQKPLMFIREAVSRREARPSEDVLPYKDIANVIKSNNSAALKLDDTWQASTKNKYIKARWDRVDEKWYRELMLSMGVTEVVKQELVPEPVEEVLPDKPVEKEMKEMLTDLKEINEYLDKNQDIVEVDLKDIVPLDKYDDIYFELKKCPEAIEIYQQIAEERILIWADYELLTKIAIKCKATKIGEKLDKWIK